MNQLILDEKYVVQTINGDYLSNACRNGNEHLEQDKINDENSIINRFIEFIIKDKDVIPQDHKNFPILSNVIERMKYEKELKENLKSKINMLVGIERNTLNEAYVDRKYETMIRFKKNVEVLRVIEERLGPKYSTNETDKSKNEMNEINEISENDEKNDDEETEKNNNYKDDSNREILFSQIEEIDENEEKDENYCYMSEEGQSNGSQIKNIKKSPLNIDDDNNEDEKSNSNCRFLSRKGGTD